VNQKLSMRSNRNVNPMTGAPEELTMATKQAKTMGGKSSTDEPPDLAEAIIKFAESLPATIGRDILIFVLVYAADFTHVTADRATISAKLRDVLSVKDDGLAKMGAVLRFIGVFDFVLWRAARMARGAKQVNQQLATRMPEKNAMRLARVLAAEPLRTKHFERAWADWSRLRDNLLTPAMLGRYEHILLHPPSPGRSDKDPSDR